MVRAEYPAGQPMQGGNAVGIKQYRATVEPGAVLTRASAARSTSQQAAHVVQMVLDPQNADLMGKVAGRVSELMVDGPQAFGLKWIGPIGTNDPKLAELHAAVKSISDLLTTVHGRRAEEAAKSFANTMKMVNSPQALAAAINQYAKIADEIAAQGAVPTTAVTGAPQTPRRRPVAASPVNNRRRRQTSRPRHSAAVLPAGRG
jgi:hypothetical protein